MQDDEAVEPQQQIEPPDKGLFCPVCHCQHVPVMQTRQSAKQVNRQRECRNCKHRFWTSETIF